jgi:hypothetical protein
MVLPRTSAVLLYLLFVLPLPGSPAQAEGIVAPANARSGLTSRQNLQAALTGEIQLTVSQQPKPLFHLEARQAPLAQILKAIADKSGAQIHYSVLPDAPVTATCIGANTETVMNCLVGKQLGLVAHKPQKDKPAEFWLLGSSVGSCQVMTVVATPNPESAKEQQPTAMAIAEMERESQEQTDAMLKQVRSADPNERYTAITNLGAMGAKDNPIVDQVLRDAMADKDTNVRAQAIASIVQRGGDDIADQFGRALQDKETNVRISAINVAKDIAILQQALNDNDPALRELAQSRLDELAKNNN